MMESKPPAFWPDRVKASAIHLTLSLAIAALAGALVFGVWYPYPYREISGGRELFLILVIVDVILGPLMTLAVFNRVKPWPVLRRDLIVIGQQMDDAGASSLRCAASDRAPVINRGWPSAATWPSTPLPSITRVPSMSGGRSTPATISRVSG